MSRLKCLLNCAFILFEELNEYNHIEPKVEFYDTLSFIHKNADNIDLDIVLIMTHVIEWTFPTEITMKEEIHEHNGLTEATGDESTTKGKFNCSKHINFQLAPS